MTKVGVMGAGAIGCWVGGRLAASSRDVVFVGRPRVREELAQHDLVTLDLAGAAERAAKEQVVVATDAAVLADRDVVLVAVKSAQTAETADTLSSLLHPGALVVSLQNGLRNVEVLRARMPAQVVVGAIVGFNVVSKGPGIYRQATAGSIILEDVRDERVRSLADALGAAGIDVERVAGLRAHQWAKLVMNLNNAVSALSDAPSRDLVFVPGYRRVVAAIVSEAVAVMRAAKIRPARLRGIPVHLFPFLLRLPTPMVKLVARAQLKIDPDARSSMWEDLARGRRTEVDDLNGEIVRLADSCGAAAPLNRRIVELVHEVEARAAGSPKMSPEALAAAIGM
ncbi:MAG: 2-dehydropantoate 2-reductase [Polyangiales bacterium]